MVCKSVGSAVVKLATAATLVLSCTLDPQSGSPEMGGAGGGGGGSRAWIDGGGSLSPVLVDVDANQVMKAGPGNGVGVFTEYKTGGHWHVWWTCDTSVSDYSCLYDVIVSVESGAITNPVPEGPDGEGLSSGPNGLEVVTKTTTAVDGVSFDTDPGAIISLDAKLDGAEDGSFLFFVQDGQINGGYQGTLSDPLLLEPAPGGA